MKSELLNVCTELLAAVANGLYQGLIITILVWLCMRVFTRTNAATRHAVWFLTLLLVVSIIPAHWAGSHRRRSTEGSVAASTGGLLANLTPPFAFPAPGNLAHNPSDFLSPPVKELIQPQPGETQIGLVPNLVLGGDTIAAERQTVLPLQPEALPAPLGEDAASDLSSHLQESAASPSKISWWRFLEPVNVDVATGSNLLRWASLGLVAAWLATACIKLMLVAWRLFQLRKLKSDAFPPSRPLEALFEQVRCALDVRRRMELRISLNQRSPLLLGFCRPVVLLGIDDSQPSELTDHILRHELAHARRYDDWANLLQRLVQSAFFFHPSVWWISRQLSLEREIACDDWVLQHARRPRAYALLLANLAARFQGCPPLLAPGALTNNSQLKQRISMILNTRRNTSPRLAKTRLGFISIAATFLALLAFYAAPRLVLAQTVAASPGQLVAANDHAGSSVLIAGADTLVSVEPAETPDAESDDELSVDSSTPEDIAPGPKAKPASPGEFAPSLTPVPPRPPTTPGPAIQYAPPLPPRVIVTTPFKLALGQPGAGPDGPYDRSSIERRLDRLEKMVQSLLAQQGATHDGDKSLWKPGNDNENEQRNKPARVQEERGRSQEDRARAQEERARAQEDRARAQAERAEQMKQAAEDIKRAAKEGELKKRDEWRAQMAIKPSPDQELQALRKAREALGRELEHLDRQIERLEQQRSRLDQAKPSPDGKHIDEPATEPSTKEHRT